MIRERWEVALYCCRWGAYFKMGPGIVGCSLGAGSNHQTHFDSTNGGSVLKTKRENERDDHKKPKTTGKDLKSILATVNADVTIRQSKRIVMISALLG